MQRTPTVAPDRLNKQALSVEEAQGLIRQAVRDALLYRQTKQELDKKAFRIIQLCLAQLTIPSLKNAAYRSLVAFYNRQRQLAAQISPKRLFLFLCLLKLTEWSKRPEDRSPYTAKISLTEARKTVAEEWGGDMPERSDEVINLGSPLQKYHRDYYRENILPTLEQMASEEALDPDSEKYWEKRSTLRNRAEREVRYQGHLDNRAELEAKGVKLVIVSAHADCSERCRQWQGRVYSLDGTSGTTSDGRKYVPLEEATDQWDKNHKWKNGLFGFNCRHYMVEYKDGYRFPKVKLETEEEQYKITTKQRYMERQVRYWRTVADMAKGVYTNEYNRAIEKARFYNERYIKYSHKNNRPYYDTRTKII